MNTLTKTFAALTTSWLLLATADNCFSVETATITFDAETLTGTYNQTEKNVVYSTIPPGLTADLTYNGSSTAPINAGHYTVVALVDDGDYYGATTNTLIINPATLTVTGVTAEDKFYDGGTNATLAFTGASLVGVLPNDEVQLDSLLATGSFATAGVGANKPVKVSGLALTGADADNYTLTQPTATASISPAEANITFESSSLEQHYNRAARRVTAITDPAGLSKTITYDGLTAAPTNAGSYTVVAVINDPNYIGSETNTLVINPAALNVTGLLAYNKEYDALTNATISAGAAGLAGLISGDTVILRTNNYIAGFSDKNVAVNKEVTIVGLTLGGPAASNYLLEQPVFASATITARNLTVADVTAEDKVYDGGTNAMLIFTGASLLGVLPDDEVQLESILSTGAFSTADAGTHKLVTVSGLALTGAEAENYTLTQPTTTASILPAEANITFELADLEQTYNHTARTVTVNTDPLQLSVTAIVTYNGGTEAPTNAGSYTVVAVINDRNYTGSETNTLVINPAHLTITDLPANDKEYDGLTNATISVGASGFNGLNGTFDNDIVTLNTNGYRASFTDKTVGLDKQVSIVGMTLNGAAASNYVLDQPVLATATITAKNLTITGVAAEDKLYDGETTAIPVFSAASLVGVLPGDNVALDYSAAVGSFSTARVGTNKLVTVTGLALTGADADNYEVADASTRAAIVGLWQPTANYTVGRNPRAICLANLRGLKNYRDACVANYDDNTVSIRLCLDDGYFSPAAADYPVGAGPAAIAFADLNRDSYDDLVTANQRTNTVSILVNQGRGLNFRPASNYVIGTTTNPGSTDVSLIDVNNDGRIDVIVANSAENSVSVLTNQGNAVFAGLKNYAVGPAPAALYVGNLDGASGVEIVTANLDNGTLSILKGSSNGVFAAAESVAILPGQPGLRPVAISHGDFNGDGITDLVVANYAANNLVVLLGVIRAGHWQVASRTVIPVGSHPQSLTVRDFNQDGLTDIACLNAGDATLQTLIGAGNGTFVTEGIYAAGNQPVAIDSSNFNNDNAGDLVIVDAAKNQISVMLFGGPVAQSFTADVLEDATVVLPLRGSQLHNGAFEYNIETDPQFGLLTWQGTNLIYTPESDYFGPDSFTYTVLNPVYGWVSTPATATINVLSVNDRPRFKLRTNAITVEEDSPSISLEEFATGLVAGPDNESSQTLSFVVTASDPRFYTSAPQIDATGKLTFKVTLGRIGSSLLTVVMKDSGGNQRGGTNTSATQTFTITTTPNPIKPLAGIYSGLFYNQTEAAVASSGFITFKVRNDGVCSGFIWNQGIRSSFTGNFNTSGYAAINVARSTGNPVQVTLQLDLTRQSNKATGTLTDGIWSARFESDRSVFIAKTNPAPQAGRYTMILPGGNTPASSPVGYGYATVTVSSNGTISAKGCFPDNTTFSQSAVVSADGYWPFYATMLKGSSTAIGWLQFTNRSASSLEGNFQWIKSPNPTSRLYTNGFNLAGTAYGSAYTAPTNGQRVINVDVTEVVLADGNLAQRTNFSSYLTTNNTATLQTNGTFNLSLPASGYSTGRYINPLTKKAITIRAIAFQKENRFYGYFLGTNQSGSFILAAPSH